MIYLPYSSTVRITSPYGYRVDPITGATGSWHGGLDLVGLNDKNIYAPCDGEIIVSQIITDHSNRTWEWGNYICLRSDEHGVLIYMCHMAERYVKAGDRVKAGDAIGYEGSTGYSTGSHCHFEIRDFNGRQLNAAEQLGIENAAGTSWENPKGFTKTSNDGDNINMDNQPDSWAEESVDFAVNNGILYGNEYGDYKLRSDCTRQEMLVFLYRLYNHLIG